MTTTALVSSAEAVGGKFIDGVKGAAAGMAIENIFASFKEAFSVDSTYRKGTVTMEEINPSTGEITAGGTSSESIPGGLSLKTGCSNCVVPPGTGSMLYASTGDIYARDNRWDHQVNLPRFDAHSQMGTIASKECQNGQKETRN